jgi:exodeoxyribonuclease V alpha subunit
LHRAERSDVLVRHLAGLLGVVPLLTRELLYTAVTRAKKHVRVIGTHAALARAVQTPIVRASGLRGFD